MDLLQNRVDGVARAVKDMFNAILPQSARIKRVDRNGAAACNPHAVWRSPHFSLHVYG